ncbi:unnamed protein product [Phytophthora fragariaefolia]|uniref:Unnamed protein product n=1 Tax=Phytophthora fragariaefolia TaxID=1490495 RepID=A0A9W7CYK5_9STRA|nr:unnamed protein product [Phytophthora fragariaefolia]
MDGIPRCPDERTRASGGRCTKESSVVHWTLEWIPGVGPVQYLGTDAEGGQEEDLVSEVTMESIGENYENFDDAHALGEAFPPDGGEVGSQGDQTADNPPWTMNEDAGDPTGPRPMLPDPNRPDLSTPAGLGVVRSQPSTRSFDDDYEGWAPGAESPERGRPARPDDKNADAPSVPPGANPPPSPLPRGNGGEAMSGGRPGQRQYWDQTGGE